MRPVSEHHSTSPTRRYPGPTPELQTSRPCTTTSRPSFASVAPWGSPGELVCRPSATTNPEDRLTDRKVADNLFGRRVRIQPFPELQKLRLVKRESAEEERRLSDGP